MSRGQGAKVLSAKVIRRQGVWSSLVELSGLEPGCQDRASVYQDTTAAWSRDVEGPRCLSVKEAGCQDVKRPGCQDIMDKRRLRLRAKNIVVA